MRAISWLHTLPAVLALAGLAGCGDDGAAPASMQTMGGGLVAPAMAQFEITLVNLTAGQPLSPLVLAAHGDGFAFFKVGEAASPGLEQLAESGNGAPLLEAAKASPLVYASALASGGPLAPMAGNKASVTLELAADKLAHLRLSAAAMLANTNDGFAAVDGVAVPGLAVGASASIDLDGWDAGTERNSESADTVPGPATEGSGGRRAGFDAVRDDPVPHVHLHPGVISHDAGLASSALSLDQRWDNPVARITIRRLR